MMARDMSQLREKIIKNGFTAFELMVLARKYKNLKKVYHPNLTNELTLESVIAEEARKSISLTKYYLAAVIVSGLVAFMFERADYLFMPVAFLILTIIDIYSSAKSGNRKITTEFKLMLLAIKLRF